MHTHTHTQYSVLSTQIAVCTPHRAISKGKPLTMTLSLLPASSISCLLTPLYRQNARLEAARGRFSSPI